MILCDVNVLVYAFRADAPRHPEYRAWLTGRLDGAEPVGVSDHVLSGVIRVVTHPRVFVHPSTAEDAFAFADALREQPNTVPVTGGPRHWDIFRELCASTEAVGNLVPDAYFAALAIEAGAQWITTDADYARFPGLRWRHPLD